MFCETPNNPIFCENCNKEVIPEKSQSMFIILVETKRCPFCKKQLEHNVLNTFGL